jgi:adenylate cyclase
VRKDREIERKFLVVSLPPAFSKLQGTHIQQGYLAHDPSREVRIRQSRGKFFLTVKEGLGITRKEVEVAIQKEQFERLWPLTEGHRVEKLRYAMPYKGLKIEVDTFDGDLAPLKIAEVGFKTPEAGAKFTPPKWMGIEITGRAEYYNASLAYHGSPEPSLKSYRIGALPYTVRDGRLHIVVITNTSGTRWLIPKGQPENNMSMQEVAISESVEEAGVIGTIRGGIRGRCTLRDGRTLYVFPLRISTILQKWPEVSFRKREILPLQEGIERISEKPLARCVARLAAKLD